MARAPKPAASPLRGILETDGRVRIAGVPDGYAPAVVAQLAAEGGARRLLYVAPDDETIARIADALEFFAPDMPVVSFPAWDCLPYDRVSPQAGVVARRIEALTRLADGVPAGTLVVTSAAALLQRVPPPQMFKAARFTGKVGTSLDRAALLAFLERNGYVRTDTVMEPGEYAIRGGIIDVFPPGSDEPLRLDLFGDEVDGIRSFDPLTQRTTSKRDGFDLKPISEVPLDKEAVERFRTAYRARFGAVAGGDPLYESISAGRRHAGMEHWLPLFHERLATLFDYLPDAAVILDAAALGARDARLETIADHFSARHEMEAAEAASGSPYRPVPKGEMFLGAAEWDERLQDRAVAVLATFDAGDGPSDGVLTIDAGARRVVDMAEARADPTVNLFAAFGDRLVAETASGRKVGLAAYTEGSRTRLAHLLAEQGVEPIVHIDSAASLAELPKGTLGTFVLDLEHGFATPNLVVFSEQDLLGDRLSRRPKRRRRADKFLAEATDIAEGDLVVHVDHGIGRYDGLETIDAGGAPHDCLRILYDGNDKLFLPVENIEVLSRYGSEEGNVQLDRLGGASWQSRKAKLKQRIADMAQQLIAVAAQRAVRTGETVTPPEGLWDEFCARFPYPETDDQLKAIEEVIDDLGSGRPMDRLVCGDVGFGKTEVALRAAFIAVMAGLQVAVVVPTTLLARQHYKTFSERFSGLPVKVGQLSRMVSAKDAKATKAALADGRLDIVVGTHALLAKSIQIKHLGMLIVDEEQHFGVAHKERLKQMRADIHVLTLTATPIPRTLQLALSGVREMSIIATPPVDRLAVRTFVMPYDSLTIREALLRERYRGGQCFYVCPRLKDLEEVREKVLELMPDARIAVAHGQLLADDLEAVMSGFYEGAFDVLISTNIVESGLDIPSANTLIVHRADLFGLAQLYQLRGRVGRGKLRGYAYLTLPQRQRISKAAERRLQVMQSLDTLGAGFTLASHDLDIRGAGNLLGDEQSGHIREVGIELYQQMLEEAVAEAKAGGAAVSDSAWSPTINIGTPVLIPESYVAELPIRLGLYRRLGAMEEKREIDAFAAEMVDRFGPLPEEVDSLLQVMAIKRLCRIAGVEKIDAGPKGLVVAFRRDRFANPAGLVQWLAKQAGAAKLRPDHRLVIARAWTDAKSRLNGVQSLLRNLASLATQPKKAAA